MTFEYRLEFLDNDKTNPELVAGLNALGRQGWEMVGFLPHDSERFVLCCFKRRQGTDTVMTIPKEPTGFPAQYS